METLIGFVAGYLVGMSEGKDGLRRMRSSWQSIRTSPEVRRLAREALTLAQAAARQASDRILGGSTAGVTDLLARKASDALARRGTRAA